ncbi:MAG: hypothetical protein ACREND_09440 [Gemmatimonadaceae bacterium]
MTMYASPPIPLTTRREHRIEPAAAGKAVTSSGPARPAIRLAGEHFAVATLYLVAGAVGLVWVAPQLAAGDFTSPRVAGVTHLFTLGWLTITIFGALYQLLPVALGAPIRWPRAGHASLAAFAPGVGAFALGVALRSTILDHAGVCLVAIGVVLAVANVAATLPRARHRDVTWAAVAIAITYLSSTLVLGVLLLHNIHTGSIAAMRIRVLATHLHVAIVGWALVMIVGVSHRLLPMFLLAHGADTQWTRRALAALAIGLPFLGTGLLTGAVPAAWTGALMLELGVACFVYQASRFFHARVRKRLDIGVRYAAFALAFLAADGVLGALVLWRGAETGRLATTYVFVGLLGGIVLFVVGLFYKIVPLLAWTARYGGKATVGAPTVAEMFSASVARVQLGLMTGAVVLAAGAILAGSRAGTYAAAALFLAGVLLFAGQIIRVALGRAVGSRA